MKPCYAIEAQIVRWSAGAGAPYLPLLVADVGPLTLPWFYRAI
jgi:hypothetical protein